MVATILFLTACSIQISFDDDKESMKDEIAKVHNDYNDEATDTEYIEESEPVKTENNTVKKTMSTESIVKNHFRNYKNNDDSRIQSEVPSILTVEKPIFSISGTLLHSGATSVEVFVYDGSGHKYDEYVLQKFKVGDTERKYNVNPNRWNIKLWKNIYMIAAHFDDGAYAKHIVEVDFDDEDIFYEYLDAPEEFCMLDVCNYTDRTFTKSGDVFIQKNNKYEESHPFMKIEYVPGEYIKAEKEIGYTKVYYSGDFLIKYVDSSFCSFSFSQEVYHKNGDPIALTEIGMPAKITIGNISYGKATLNFSAQTEAIDADDLTIESLVSSVEGRDGIKINFLTKTILLKNHHGIPVKYTLLADELTDDNKSFEDHAHDGFIVVKKIDPANVEFKKYDINSYSYSKKLAENLLTNFGEILRDKDGNMLAEYIEDNNVSGNGSPYKLKLQSNRLPVFAYYPLNDKYDIIVTTRGHRVATMAEMCKPAIYVYDQKERSHKVQIEFQDLGHFTHLEPELNIDNWRKYQATNHGDVVVGGQNFDYLYYAVAVNNYDFNPAGRVVKWTDIEIFFDEKLDKIWFKSNEKEDFMDYWLGKFKPEKLYFMSFKFNEDVDKYISLSYSKSPKTANRVLMESYIVDQDISFRESRGNLYKPGSTLLDQAILKRLTRDSNFDIFEWGGVFWDRDTGKFWIF